MRSIATAAASFLAILLAAAPAVAQDRDVPYWATIRASELNLRIGPSEDYRIEWVYRRPGLPIKVLRRLEGWRLIQDPDGAQGWVVARLLSDERGAYVIGKGLAEMRAEPNKDAEIKWRVEPGVTAALGRCDETWCAVTIGARHGYIRQQRLWGAGNP